VRRWSSTWLVPHALRSKRLVLALLNVNRRGDRRAGRSRAERELWLDVPEIRGDETVGAGEEMIRDEQRDPILDVGATGAHLGVAETTGNLDRLSVRSVGNDQRVVLESLRFVEIGRRLSNHRDTDRLDEEKRRRRLVSPEDALRKARREKS